MATVAASEHTARHCAAFRFWSIEEAFGDAVAIMVVAGNTTSRAPDSNGSDVNFWVIPMVNKN